jgi:hypothetical protein
MSAQLDPSQLSLQERRDLLFRAGHLRHLCRPYQLPIYDAFHEWKATRAHPDQTERARQLGAKFRNMFVALLSRRYGKTSLGLIFGAEEMIARPGCSGLIACPTRQMIPAIILKCIDDVFADAPEGYKPEYKSTHKGMSDVIVVPATDSVCRLVGLDLHPDRLRGAALDFAHLSECSFMNFEIDATWRSVLAPQFRGRPHSWCLIESSYAESVDHPVHSVFAADAALRNALVERSILDQDLTEDEIRAEADMTGGMNHPTTRRELFNEHVPDRDRAVCTSFEPEVNVVPADYPLPEYGFGIVALDPGNTDQAGLVFLVVDPSKREVLVPWSFGASNVNTFDLAETIREQEQLIFGTKAETVVEPVRSLADILRAPRAVPHTEVGLERLSFDNNLDPSIEPVLDAPPGALTYWDSSVASLRPNPWARVSDVGKQQLQDLRDLYGLRFDVPGKAAGNLQMQIDLLNKHLHDGTLRILDNPANQGLLKQIRSGRWNVRRTDFERTATLGHLDILVALSIGLRAVDFSRDPRRPIHARDPGAGFFIDPGARRYLEPLRPPTNAKKGRSLTGKRYGR